MILGVFGIAAAADCPRVESLAQLEARLDTAEQAYAALDEPAFLEQADALLLLAPCLAEPATPNFVARLHGLVAMRVFATQPQRAKAAARAARSSDPAWPLATLVGPTHPIAEAWASAPTPPTQALPRPQRGALWLDGQPGRLRATDRPTFFQRDERGRIVDSVWLDVGEPAPAYPRVPPARAPLRGVGVGALAGAGAAYTYAWTQASRFEASGLDADQLRATRGRANAATGAAAGLALSGVVSLVIGELVR